MIYLNIQNETSYLKAVILGTAESCGQPPSLEAANDPKTKQHLAAGTYPKEIDMVKEMNDVERVLKKHGVKVYRPELIENYYQIFTRDIGFVIEDRFIKSNILASRAKELTAIDYILQKIPSDQIIEFPEEVHIEGGDVMPHGDYIFVGTYHGEDYADLITARTNPKAIVALKELFPHKTIKSFNLRKSDTDPYHNALHLDCCFQPVCKDKAIIHKNSFLDEAEYEWLVNHFGNDNLFEITKEEMYHMNSNIFSISEDLIISEKNFDRLNTWLRQNGIQVEEVAYAEIAKQEGLLRCSTLPLLRA